VAHQHSDVETAVDTEYPAEVGIEIEAAVNVGAEPVGREAGFVGSSLVACGVVLAVQHQDNRKVDFEETHEFGQKIDLGIHFRAGI
jgi:hypothetical protein